jgi:hypothetical protein
MRTFRQPDFDEFFSVDRERKSQNYYLNPSEKAKCIEEHLRWLNGKMPSEIYKMTERESSISFKIKLKYAHRRLQHKMNAYRFKKEGK